MTKVMVFDEILRKQMRQEAKCGEVPTAAISSGDHTRVTSDLRMCGIKEFVQARVVG